MTTSPIFVVGASRSGTAMLRAALNAHNGVRLAGETHYFDDLRQRMKGREQSRLSPQDRDECERYFLALAHRPYGHGGQADKSRLEASSLRDAAVSLGQGSDSYFEAFCRLKQDGPSTLDGSRWGEKTPRHVFRLSEILTRYPSAQVVCMVRDPRAVVASYRDWQSNYQGGFDLEADPGHAAALEAERERAQASYDPSIASLLWRASVTAAHKAQRQFGPVRVRVQRYEDFVTDPSDQLQAMAAWLQMDFQPQMLDVPMHNSSFSSFARGTGVSTVPLDRWKQKLDSTEVATVQTWCSSAMKEAGYEMEDVRLGPLGRARAFKDLSVGSARALRSNRDRAGNLVTYVWRRARLALSPT